MWYVLQVKTGSETPIGDELHRLGYPSLAPKEMSMRRKGGNWHGHELTLFPGYVFTNLDYTADNYYKVKGISGVIRFLGTGAAPTPLTPQEAEWIKSMSGPASEPVAPTKVQFLEDGRVEILSGVLQNFIGRPIKFDKRQRKALLEITVGGQTKSVKLSIEPVF